MTKRKRPRKNYRYKVLAGKEYQPWSGTFHTIKASNEWFKKYGKAHEARGHKLKLFVSHGEKD